MSTGAALWTPPDGMSSYMAASWRAFYRSIQEKYGMTPVQYRALYLAQKGRCFICRRARGKHPDDPRGGGARRLSVDHNHALGDRIEAVRGLLCGTGDMSCNRRIGAFERDGDSYAAIMRAAVHISEAPAQSVFAALEHGYTDKEITGMVIRP